MTKNILLGGVVAAFVVGGASIVQATPVAGGPVDSGVFSSAGLGDGTGYSYVGSKTGAFSGTGEGTLTLRSAGYANSFGYSKTNHSDKTTIFASTATAGTTTRIDPSVSPFLFYFSTPGSGGNGPGSDPAASIFTDGYLTPATADQVGLAIYNNGSMYAFFFDDGGPDGCTNNLNPQGNCTSRSTPRDDNDFNDFVVTYTPTPTTVPEPMSLALLGTGLAGIGVFRRGKKKGV